MKYKIIIILFWGLSSSIYGNCQTWDEWFKQKKTQRKYMLAQIAKLQLYLGYLKKGYDIVHSGMDLISDIKAGDLTLHSVFFDHLKKVSPSVKRYEKVTELVRMYTVMFNSYKTSFKKFKESGRLSGNETDYLYQVFTNLLSAATDDMELLTGIITDNYFEMSDDERLRRIDVVYDSMMKKYNSLFSFIDKTNVLLMQRQKELKDLETLQNLYLP